MVSDGRAEFKRGHVVPNKATVISGKCDHPAHHAPRPRRAGLPDRRREHRDGVLGRRRPGDVNGDGSADVMLGAPFAGPNGAVFVVYGKADTLMVDVGSLAGKGFRIDGAPGDRAGSAVAPAGDVNGDGRRRPADRRLRDGRRVRRLRSGNSRQCRSGVAGRRRLSHRPDGDRRCRGRCRRHSGDGRADLLLGRLRHPPPTSCTERAATASVDLAAPGGRERSSCRRRRRPDGSLRCGSGRRERGRPARLRRRRSRRGSRRPRGRGLCIRRDTE